MHTITKGQKALINAYNTYYIEYFKNDPFIDEGVLLAAHDHAQTALDDENQPGDQMFVMHYDTFDEMIAAMYAKLS